ncbi:MAG: hypothetical protein WC836_14660 [Desulfobacula sp.]|jgi:hypothetical protein
MANIITVQVPDTDDNQAIIARLLGIPGIKIETCEEAAPALPAPGQKYVNLQEGAAIARVNYFTFRKWVIEQKKIPYERPSGAKKGGVRLLAANIEAFLEGRGRKKATRGGSVRILD